MPGGPPKWVDAANSHAVMTMKPGLRNSDGCTDANPSEYQRVAPLPKSVPKTGSNNNDTNAPKNPKTASRRTITGYIIDTAIITAIAVPPNTVWRIT